MKQIKLLCALLTLAIAVTVFATAADAKAETVRVGLALPSEGSGAKTAVFASSLDFNVYCNGIEIMQSSRVTFRASGQTMTIDGTSVSGTVLIYPQSTVKLALDGREYAYDGCFEISLESRRLKVINVLPLEDYVSAVMPCEIGSNECDEITKAAAIMIRTVPFHRKHASDGCDVCATSCCQNYRGICTDIRLCGIAEQTKGMIITYGGEPIVCTYCNSNGGASCPSGDAWGGQTKPYLQSVLLDEGDECIYWQKTLSQKELFDAVTDYLGVESELAGISAGKSEAGFVTLLTCYCTDGSVYYISGASTIRKLWALESARFDIYFELSASELTASGLQKCGDAYLSSSGACPVPSSPVAVTKDGEQIIATTAVISGSGSGHCVGFSLAGARVLAAKGYDYKQILTFFFTGTEIKR